MSQGVLVYTRGVPRARARRKAPVVSQVAICEVRKEAVGDTRNPSAAVIDARPHAKPIRRTHDSRLWDERPPPDAIPLVTGKDSRTPGALPLNWGAQVRG